MEGAARGDHNQRVADNVLASVWKTALLNDHHRFQDVFGISQRPIATKRLSGSWRKRGAHLDSLREQIQPDGTAPVRLFEMSDQRAEERTPAFRDIGISLLNPAADTAPRLVPFAVLLG